MKTTFWLIRHAETAGTGKTLTGRLPGVHLSPNGLRQADLLVQALRQVSLQAVYASPLERTMETARLLAEARNLSVVPCKAANEVDYGEWAGKNWIELQPSALWRRFNEQRSVTAPPGGELMLQIQARIIRAMAEMRVQYPDQHVAIVSHGDVIRSAVAHLAGIPLDLLNRIEISLASFSTIEWHEDGPRVLRLNQTAEI